MNNLRSIPLCVLASAFLCTAAALAQQAAPAVRILSPIDENNLVTLKGNTLPVANAKNDQGRVSNSLPMTGLVLVLSRSPEQQAAFDAFVASQYDSSSPYYHQWLTAQQVGAQFGPAQADIATITGWLASHGFAVKGIGADRMTIQFSGTAGQVESAFHTEIHNLSVNGKAHIANMSDPQIPAAISPVVLGIKGLHSFLPHPLHRLGSKVRFNPDAHGWVKLGTSSGAGFTAGALRTQAKSASSPKPSFYYPIPNGNGVVEEDVAPYDFAKIYSLPSTWPSSTNGSGQTITIIGTSDINLTDVSSFKTAFGLPAGLTPEIAHGPDGDPGNCGNNPSSDVCNDGDLEENSLDVEWSGAVAPGAQIVLVTDAYNSQTTPTNDPIYDDAQWAIANAAVTGSAVYGSHILSVSYGECELFNGTASNVAYNNLWETAASGGIAVFVATGDAGSPACDDDEYGVYGNPYEAQYGLSVSGTASSPYDTAVGGTDFSWCQPSIIVSGSSKGDVQGCSSSNASTYWNTSNSTQEASAKGYVPETPWNDTCENPIWAEYIQTLLNVSGEDSNYGINPTTPEETCSVIYRYWQHFDSDWESSGYGDPYFEYFVDTIGGSGGASSCVVNTTTSTTSGSCGAGDTSTGSSYGNLTLVSDGWPKPSWQSGITGIPSDGIRDLPDVSFFAGDGSLDSATLICVSNDGASCTSIGNTGSTTSGGAEEVGGTSVATPEMAGVMALINQHAGAAQGLPNAELYDLAGRQTYSSCSAESVTSSSSCYFQDIDNGPAGYSNAQTNSMPCDLNNAAEGGDNGGPYAGTTSPNCTALNSGDTIGTLVSSGTTQAYNSATGFDLATGLGSLNIANVVSAWPTGAPVKTFALSATDVTVAAGATSGNTSTIAVEPTDGFTGTVNFTCSVTTSPSSATSPVTCGAIASATVTGSAEATTTMTVTSTSTTTGGSYVITVTGTYGTPATITQTTTVNVTIAPTYSMSAGAASSVSPGGSTTSAIAVSSSSGYAGSITLSCALNSGGPSNQSGDAPSCSITSGSPLTLSASIKSGQAIATVTTAAASTSDLVYPKFGNGKGWMGAGGGAVLALLVFFGIPARRRSWRSMLSIVVAMVAFGVLASCGGGGSSSTTTTTTNPGTTAGTYTFTVTGSGITPAPTATFQVVVN